MALSARNPEKSRGTPLERLMNYSLRYGGFRREVLEAILDDIRMNESDVSEFIQRENRMRTWQQPQVEDADEKVFRQIRKNRLRHFSVDLALCAMAVGVGALAMAVASLPSLEAPPTAMGMPASLEELVNILRDMRDDGVLVYEPLESGQGL